MTAGSQQQPCMVREENYQLLCCKLYSPAICCCSHTNSAVVAATAAAPITKPRVTATLIACDASNLHIACLLPSCTVLHLTYHNLVLLPRHACTPHSALCALSALLLLHSISALALLCLPSPCLPACLAFFSILWTCVTYLPAWQL